MKKYFHLQVNAVNNSGVSYSLKFHVLAETKWEAIERGLTRYREIQPDRLQYTIIAKWDMESAKCIAFLACAAVNYTMNYS
jgi:hypothetical protein